MSRTKEQRAWDTFKNGIDPKKIHPLRIENLYSGEGMPDVLCINKRSTVFWLELKALDGWPARESTRPLRTAFEPGQLAFGRQWMHWGGLSYVLLRVGQVYYLLNPNVALDDITTAEVINSAIRAGKSAIIEFLEEL